MSNQDSVLSGDPRTQDIEDQFQVLISGIARAFGTIAHVKGLRATHSYGTIATPFPLEEYRKRYNY